MRLGARFYGYALGVVALILLAAWIGQKTWAGLRELRGSFVFMQAEDLYISEYIEAAVRDVNETTLRYVLRQDAEDRAALKKLGIDLEENVGSHQETFTLPEQREFMHRIAPALRAHLSRMDQLATNAASGNFGQSPKSLIEEVDRSAAPVLDLCRMLKTSELNEQSQFMLESQRAFQWIETLLISTLIALAVLVATSLAAVYRGVISPLRNEVRESRALVARNEKLASLGTLAAGVAHEIRNPLTAINVRLHSLKKGLVPHSSEQEDAVVIGHEIDRLDCLVKEFLQFARPSDPKRVAVSADGLLGKVQSLLAAKLENGHVKLDIQSEPDIWLRADPHQIEQVLINLIQNAADSMESGGAITLRVRTGETRLGGRQRPAVMLDVIDPGKGIPPDVQKRIFDPFFSTKEDGTGLGLAIALRIVEKHGGSLEFRSVLNSGTTFTIVLPQSASTETLEAIA